MVNKMKNLFASVPKKVKSFLVGVMAMGMLLPTILPGLGNMAMAAGPHFNDNAQDRPTLQVTNYTTNPDGYGLSTSVKPGDQVAFKVYIHNNEPDTVAYATRVLATITNGYNTSHTGTATISASNAASVSGSATITSSQPVKLTFVDNTTRRWWFTDASMQYVQYEVMPNTILNGGIDIRDVNGCWQWIQYVTYVFNVEAQPVQPAVIGINKQVALVTAGGNPYVENVTAKNGDTVSFSLGLTNTGGSAATNVVVKDVLPSGLEFISGSTKLNGNAIADTLFTTGVKIDSLAVGAVPTITFQAKVTASTPGVLTNTGTATADSLGQVSDTATVTIQQVLQPALSIAKTVLNNSLVGSTFAENANAKTGETVTFKLIVSNTGQSEAKNVVVADQVPAGLTYVSGSTKVDGVVDNTNAITGNGLNIANIAAGASKTVTFEATVSATLAQTITNTGTARAESVNQVGDTATVTVQQAGQPVITIAKTVSLGDGSTNFVESVNAVNNDIVRFRLIVSNNSGVSADNVKVWDGLPSGLTYIDNSTTLDGAAQSGNAVVNSGITLGTMTNGSTHTVIFNVRVNSSSATLVNYGRANINGTGQVEDPATVVVGGVSNTTLSLDKQVARGENGTSYYESVSAENSEYVRFRMVVRNTGTVRANNVQIADNLPSGLTYVSNSTYLDGVRQNDIITSGRLDLSSMDPGVSRTVTFNARVNTSSNSTITNEATVTSDNATSVRDTAQVQANGSDSDPYLEITKEVDQAVADPGDELRYTIRVRNTGSGDATNVRIVDDLPERVRYVSGSLTITGDGDVEDDDLFDDGVIIDRLEPGDDVLIRFTARVDSDITGNMTLENVAIARDDQGDRAEDEVVTEIEQDEAYLDIDKQVDKSRANPGDELRYTITVRNTGYANATNVRVYDDLPSYVEVVSGSLSVSGDHISSSDLFDNYVRASYLERNDEINITFRAKIRGDITNDMTLDNVARVTADDGLSDRDVASTYIGANVLQPSFKLSKLVRNETKGESTFNQSNTSDPGNVMEYKITLTNNGSSRLTGVKLNDILPNGLMYLGGTAKASMNNYDISGDWNKVVEQGGVLLPDMNANDIFTLVFKVKSKTDIAANSTLVNTVNVVADQNVNAQATASTSFTQIAQPQELPKSGPEVALAGFIFMAVSAAVWFLREKWLLTSQMM